MNKKNEGITLIALVITIIIMLILVAVTSTIAVNGGLFNYAIKAKEQTNLAILKEQTEVAIMGYKLDNISNDRELTVSEIVDKLKEDNFIDNNMKFTQNNDYRLTYNGYIKNTQGEIVENIKLSDEVTEIEVSPYLLYPEDGVGTRTIKCINGIVTHGNKDWEFYLNSNEAPSGYKFGYWIDENDNIYSYQNRRWGEGVSDNIFTAIYVKEDIDIVPQICVNAYSTTQMVEEMLSFNAITEVPKNLNITSCYSGVLGTSNKSIANTTDLVVDKSYEDVYYKKSKTWTVDVNNYSWTKSNVGTNTWYVRGYATVTYTDGTTETFYSPTIVSAHR